MNSPILKIEEISKSFGRKQILQQINIEIYSGEIIGIIGSSGSGKTTLLNTIIGFIEPDSGKVKFRFKNKEGSYKYFTLENQNKKHISNTYGFASQIPSFYEKLTVRENLEYFGELYGLSKETLIANTNTLLKLMNLENSENVLAKKLSGGMERRLNIACSMIHNPDILILDEPTADLDPIMRNNIWNLIEKINAKGTTIILSSHHLTELETLCNRISIIKDGKILETATPQELKRIYTKNEEIKLQSYPGNYKKIGEQLTKEFSNIIKTYSIIGKEMTIKCDAPYELLNDIIKNVEKIGEKIIEIKLVKPNLDDIFIKINEIKIK